MSKRSNIVGVITPQVLETLLTNSAVSWREDFKQCSFLEIRYDLFSNNANWPDLAEIILSIHPKAQLIGTIRLECDGGRTPDRAAKGRLIDWTQILQARVHPHWIDLEQDQLEVSADVLALASSKKVQVLASRHDFHKVPCFSELSQAVQAVRARKLGGFKIAAMSHESGDCQPLYRLAREESHGFKLFSAFAMGESGRNSREHSLLCGANLSYGALGAAVAPGQIEVCDMIQWLQKQRRKGSNA